MEKDTYNVYIYNIINDKVMTDKIVIYNNLNIILEKIVEMKNDIEVFVYLKDMLDLEKRLQFLMNIENLEMDEEIKKKLILVNYMILNDGSIKKIKNFDIVKNNLEKIKSIGIESLGNIENLEQEKIICEEKINDKNTTILEKMRYIVRLTSIYGKMENEVDKKKTEMLETLEKEIIKEREKFIENKVMKNEFDIINNAIRENLEGDKIDSLEIEKCIYNGVEISHSELVEELISHVFPEYLTQKNIEDTYEDWYEVDMNYMKIKRLVGGEIIIEKK